MHDESNSNTAKALQSISDLLQLGIISKTEYDKLRKRIREVANGNQPSQDSNLISTQANDNHQNTQQPIIVKTGNGCITFLLFIIALPTLIGILIYIIIFGAIGCTFIS